jgi:hypothetical protein
MIELKIDTRAWEQKLKAIDGSLRQMPFLISYALNKSMYDARDAARAEMAKVFDRPTPYTLNSLKITPSTKSDLRAELSFREFPRPAWKWLGPQVHGGRRGPKAFENALRAKGILGAGQFVVPGPGVRLNAYGNIPAPLIVQVLSQIGAAEYKAGFQANMTARSRGRAIKKAGGQFFVVKGKGVYKRSGKTVVPVLIFVSAASYRARFPYYDVARRTIPAAFERHFREAFERFVVKDIRRAA